MYACSIFHVTHFSIRVSDGDTCSDRITSKEIDPIDRSCIGLALSLEHLTSQMFDLAFISPIPIFRPNTCLGQNHCRRRPFPVITSAALLSPEISRRQSLRVLLSGIATLSIAPALITHAEDEVKTASGLTYTVVKKGDGPQPNVGDLIAIRFRGSYNGVVFDDIFKTSEPYFYRLGSGSILKVRPQCSQFSQTKCNHKI